MGGDACSALWDRVSGGAYDYWSSVEHAADLLSLGASHPAGVAGGGDHVQRHGHSVYEFDLEHRLLRLLLHARSYALVPLLRYLLPHRGLPVSGAPDRLVHPAVPCGQRLPVFSHRAFTQCAHRCSLDLDLHRDSRVPPNTLYAQATNQLNSLQAAPSTKHSKLCYDCQMLKNSFVVRPAKPRDDTAIAGLVVEGFLDKFRPIFGRRMERSVKIMERWVHLEHSLGGVRSLVIEGHAPEEILASVGIRLDGSDDDALARGL